MLLTLATLVGLVAASPALGLRTVRSALEDGALSLEDTIGCGVPATDQIFLARRVSHITVHRPRVGAAIYRESDRARIGTVSSVSVIRHAGGGQSVRFVATGGFALCDPSAQGFAVDVLDPWFGIRYRYRLLKETMQDCGEFELYRDTGLIQANGYVATCRKARRVGRAWKRHAALCHLDRCPTIITGGYTCHHRRALDTLYVTCRRGQAILRFWGPDYPDAPG